MDTNQYNKFWVLATTVITIVMLIILFPKLLDKYGPGRAILLSSLIPFAMFLAYLRGYWISTWLSKKHK